MTRAAFIILIAFISAGATFALVNLETRYAMEGRV